MGTTFWGLRTVDTVGAQAVPVLAGCPLIMGMEDS